MPDTRDCGKKLRIAVVVIATAHYRTFVPKLYKEVKEHFLPQHDVEFVLFSDDLNGLPCDRGLLCEHRPWPFVTLHKFHRFSEHEDIFRQFDYCYMLDADCAVERTVSEAMLGPLVAVIHPGFCGTRGTPCQDIRSRAYLPRAAMRTPYVAGGVLGGRTDLWLSACRELAQRIDLDLREGVIATFHDESHWLKYVNEPDNLLKLKVLDWEYCYSYEQPPPGGPDHQPHHQACRIRG